MLRDFLASLPEAGLGLTLTHIQCLSNALTSLARSLSKPLSFHVHRLYKSPDGCSFRIFYIRLQMTILRIAYLHTNLAAVRRICACQTCNTKTRGLPSTPQVCTYGDTL